jgi:plastocyanin
VTPTTCGRGVAALVLASLVLFVSAQRGDGQKDKGSEVIVITIKGMNADAFVKDGDTKTKDVTVMVGQKVKWVCKDCDTHTVTCTVKDKDGKALFDTGDLNVNESKEIAFDAALFAKAGGKAGGKVELPYLCEYHPRTMKSKIILVSPAK